MIVSIYETMSCCPGTDDILDAELCSGQKTRRLILNSPDTAWTLVEYKTPCKGLQEASHVH